MNVNYIFSLIVVVALSLLAFVGVEVLGLQMLFGIIIPYAAVITFVVFFVRRVMGWAASPVPFRIPTTCGQQKSLPWIQQNKIDNPSSGWGVLARMALEIFLFRSLFRNTKMSLEESKLSYKWEIWLWVGALAFHYSFLVVILRHLRFFFEPVPLCIKLIETLDGFFRIEFMSNILQVGLPGIYISGLVLLGAVTFLFLRRIVIPQVRYISLAADYFPLFLIMGIAITGIMMRYFTKVDIVAIKGLAMGLVTFNWTVPEGISSLFYIHLFFVSVLLVYFPFSKLMHLGGIFLSPTRNLANTNRSVRHINPWNSPVHVHTYEEYEDEFREKMIEAGLPVDKE
ncbi:MAG: menaquinol oxidoreductase [Desulfobacteraceae bacterium]|nr:menaquinol oxidoreductase [Desulfobacteraceae bacterium]MBU4054637.1 sulfate reduction electron transfer complex DsrMKJOP subunit DsrM [Pseudomonadota bacterium]